MQVKDKKSCDCFRNLSTALGTGAFFLATFFLFSFDRASANGHPLVPDKTQISEIRLQARAGNDSAENSLGNLYYDGRGVRKSFRKAAFWFRKSALAGNPSAEKNLGWILLRGEGVLKNPEKAEKWLNRAAEAGNARAMNILGSLYLSKKREPAKAARWFLRGARAGNREAQFNLGSLYDRGLGLPLSYEKAAFWWKKSARQGDTTAQTALGGLYERGQGVPRDYGNATYWYRVAASGGNPLARESLSVGPWSPVMRKNTPRSQRPLAKSGPVPVSVSVSGDAVMNAGMQAMVAKLQREVALFVESRKEKRAPVFHTSVDHPDYRSPEKKEDFAVVVGIEDYPGTVPAAPFANRDARSVVRHLEALGIPSEHIRLLNNGMATRGGLDASVLWLSKNVLPASTVYFYYSGHGVSGGRHGPSLAPSGVDPSDLADTGYSLNRLYQNLGKIQARRVIVILDSCFSGAGPRALPTPERPVLVERTGPLSTGVAVLASSKEFQASGVYPEKGHGLFTYYFLRGLNGHAGKNGHITLSDLYRYLRSRVARSAHLSLQNQTPTLTVGNPEISRMRLR